MNAPVDVLAAMDREIAGRELGPSGHAVGCVEHPPGARFPCSCNGPQLTEARAAVAELIELARMVDRSDNAARWGDACRPIVTKARECLALVGGAS